MILTLEVTGRHVQGMGADGRKVFNAIGGTIGRLPDNDWVITDPYVSGRHASIRYLDGKFFVEDTSTNGVFINSIDNRLTRGQPQQLHDGDLLFLDAYQVRVSIQPAAAAGMRPDPFVGAKTGGPTLVPARTPSGSVVPAEDRTANLPVNATRASHQGTVVQDLDEDEVEDEDEAEEEAVDHSTEWLNIAVPVEPKRAPPRPAQPTPAPTEVMQPVVPPSGPSTRRVPPPPQVVKAAPSAPLSSSPQPMQNEAPLRGAQLQVLLEAAGIEGLNPSSEVAAMLGEILRISLTGVMDALHTRERMKDDLRMRGTTFKATDNNPLKFSANVDDAFHNLLVKRNPAYLKPADAFEEAFRDVREHQFAFQAAMRLAFESMLSQFDPQHLQEEFDRQMKGSILGVPAKLRYWDSYRDKYSALARDAEAGFRTLFGEAFARVYEEHLERLKRSSRSAS